MPLRPELVALKHLRLDSQLEAQVRDRLNAGAEEYGNTSFNRPADELYAEIREELLDVIGWTCILKTAHPDSASRAIITAHCAVDILEMLAP